MNTDRRGPVKFLFVCPDFSCFPGSVAIKRLPEARLPDAHNIRRGYGDEAICPVRYGVRGTLLDNSMGGVRAAGWNRRGGANVQYGEAEIEGRQADRWRNRVFFRSGNLLRDGKRRIRFSLDRDAA